MAKNSGVSWADHSLPAEDVWCLVHGAALDPIENVARPVYITDSNGVRHLNEILAEGTADEMTALMRQGKGFPIQKSHLEVS